MSFRITLLPQASDKDLDIVIDGQRIIYDGVSYDFSTIADGFQVEASYPAVGVIKNVGGVIEISLIFPYNFSLAEPVQPASGNELVFDIADGTVPNPIIYKEV